MTLLRKGARLVERAEDVIEELKPQIRGILKEDRNRVEMCLPKMTESEKRMFVCLDNEPKHIDAIIRETEKSSSETLSILLSLELKGIVRQIDGKRFITI